MATIRESAVLIHPRIFHFETERSTAFLRAADLALPRPLFNFLVKLGVWAAVFILREPRRNSRCYLTAILGRPPALCEIWRHYMEFTTMHLLRLRVAAGQAHHCRSLPGGEEFAALMRSGRPALLGSFHIGDSDLLGFFLGQFRRHVYMVRYRLGDPNFLRQLASRSSAWVTFIWANEKENLLFALKEAAETGGSIAMKCDRVGYSAKVEMFEFLGAHRSFPFTIYHLGILFQLPVTFCVSSPGPSGESLVHSFPVFEPDAEAKAVNLQRARTHFQLVLTRVEALLRANPYLWFNFAPLNPVATIALSPVIRPSHAFAYPSKRVKFSAAAASDSNK
jgi:predicted LPLAT superfamily acyltransferase